MFCAEKDWLAVVSLSGVEVAWEGSRGFLWCLNDETQWDSTSTPKRGRGRKRSVVLPSKQETYWLSREGVVLLAEEVEGRGWMVLERRDEGHEAVEVEVEVREEGS